MAAEACKDELSGFGVPVKVDGHAGAGVEARTQGDMEGEEARHALVGRAIVGGIADLGVLTEVAPEVAEPGLRCQAVVQLEAVGGVGLELGEGGEAGEVAVQGPVVLKHTGRRLLDGLRQDQDVFGKLGLSHMRGENVLSRDEILVGLIRRRKGFVDWREESLPHQSTADLHRIAVALGGRTHREVLRRCQVEADGGTVGQERDHCGGGLQSRADHLEGILSDALDILQETASREFIAIVETEGGGAHVRRGNSSFPSGFHPARGSEQSEHLGHRNRCVARIEKTT